MVAYLVRRYILLAIPVTILLLIAQSAAPLPGVGAPLASPVIVAGLVTVYLVHRWFTRRNLWVLYRNLRLSKVRLLALCFCVFEIPALIIVTLFR